MDITDVVVIVFLLFLAKLETVLSKAAKADFKHVSDSEKDPRTYKIQKIHIRKNSFFYFVVFREFVNLAKKKAKKKEREVQKKKNKEKGKKKKKMSIMKK